MQKKIVNFVQLLILIFYRVQHKIYRQIFFNLFNAQFAMIFIEIKTINFIQNNKKRLIIMNFVIFDHIEFLRVKNRINISYFRAMNDLFIVENMKNIINQKKHKREHFKNVITHFTKNEIKIKIKTKNLIRNQYVSKFLKQNDDQNDE